MRRLIVVAVLALAAMAGCGGDGLSDTAARSLDAKVAAVRAAAEARQADVARAKLVELRAEVQALQGRGELDAEQARSILASAALVEEQLALITTTTTAPPPPPTTLPRRDKDRDEDKEGKDD